LCWEERWREKLLPVAVKLEAEASEESVLQMRTLSVLMVTEKM
jgi:hypothetical protein